MTDVDLQKKAFLVFLLLVSVAFALILLPFYGAVFWASVLAILFEPLYRRLLARMPGRQNIAASLTLIVCLLLVILPIAVITTSLIQEGTQVYNQVRSGKLDISGYIGRVMNALPSWLTSVLDRLGLSDLSAAQPQLPAGTVQGSGQYIASRAINIGQNTFDLTVSFFVMLYLLFFLLRDGSTLAARVVDAIPLGAMHKRYLLEKFTTVIRATVKGNIVVAIVQGALGGLAFWYLNIQGALLWAVLMGFLSLLPAVGAALVWLPVALYFLVTGALWQGVGLIVYGVLVIGLVDNVLRPILVGKDTKMPDYVVLISTLGGMALVGLNGFVIGPMVAALFIATWDLFAATPPDKAPPERR